MDIYNFISDKSQHFGTMVTSDNYYPMLLFIVSVTILIIFIARVITGVIMKYIIIKYDSLSEKIAKKVKNLVTGFISFFAIMIVLSIFFYADNILWITIFKFITTLFIVYFTFAVMSIGKSILVVLSHRENAKLITYQTLPLFHNVINIVISVVAIYVTFAFVWGVDMTALLASMGIIGVALSFAAKDTIANFLSGIFIMADQPYRVGDFVDLDGGERGEVIDIGIRSTRIITMDDVEIVIPNSIMGNTPVINESGGPTRNTRIDVSVHIAYGSEVSVVKDLMTGIAMKSKYVVKNPFPITRFVEFGESGMEFTLLCWIKEASDRGPAIDELNTAIYESLQKSNIEIPYQKQDIYIKEFKQN